MLIAIATCMSFLSIDFFPALNTDTGFVSSAAAGLSINECDRQLNQPNLSIEARQHWLRVKAQMLTQQGQLLRALSCCNDALAQESQVVWAIAHRGLVNECLGYYELAIADYDRALALITAQQPDAVISGTDESIIGDASIRSAQVTPQLFWLWLRKGHTHRALKQYNLALEGYSSALSYQPTSALALSGRGTVLAFVGQPRNGLRDCEQAVRLEPDSKIGWNSLGLVWLILSEFKKALHAFDRALEIDATYRKAWNNRAIALSRLGQQADVLESLAHALDSSSDSPNIDVNESWYPSAWALKGFTHMKLGQFSDAIECCEQSQQLNPRLYGASFCKLVSLVASGRLLTRLSKPDSRQQLWHDVTVVFHTLKIRLLVIALVIGLVVLGSQTILSSIQSILPTLFSVIIIGLIAADLWVNRSKLNFVWQIYVKSGVLTYVRAIGILAITLTTLAIVYPIAPSFMQWGWATAVFGQSGNLIFQPFNLLTSYDFFPGNFSVLNAANELLGLALPVGLSGVPIAVVVATIAHATFRISLSVVFVVCFWLMLMIGIPFWARLEERIFRQGANSWRKICIRSVQFGLIHILVGIPILAGFVLIVPGFLFACRYKYVYSAYLKRDRDPVRAQEAGMLASTADHAVYNAILVTFISGTFALNELLIG